MARIERKAYYVGTWREDKVTDTTMRQIIARSHAEKGQKVKVKLSKDGLTISKTVLLQENFLSAIPLHDVYFLTVNQRHPTCLLCIVADPVKKYLILAIRTLNEVEAQEIISTFKALKDNPTINAGNVVLRRKENGNWTLRERSQHNADRHLLSIFNETPTAVDSPQPNGSAGVHRPVLDGSQGGYKVVSGSHVVTNGGQMSPVEDDDVNHLSQELRDVKFVVEKAGSVSPSTLNSNISQYHNNNNIEKTQVTTSPIIVNGGMVRVHSDGDPYLGDRPGEARVVVEDHRNDGVVRAHSNGSVVLNGGIKRQITVPQPNPQPSTTTTTVITATPREPSPTPADEVRELPAYTVHRRVSTEYVQVPNFNRKLSHAESVRSVHVSFDPEAVRRSQSRHNQFRSVRTSRVPTTIVRPIEEIYGRGHVPVRPSILKRQPEVYVAQQPVYVVRQPAHVVQPGTNSTRRPRSRPNSIHIMEGNELKIFHKAGQVDDVLL